ncbi:hypothetical protein OG216_40665 [Streptomycetaceae bacterium NBC_01309]
MKWTTGFALAAVAFVAYAAWAGVRLVGYLDDLDPYADARPCPNGAPPHDDCLTEVPLQVTSVVDVPGKNARHALVLTGGDFANRHVGVSPSGPMMRNVEAGDQVVATVWRNRVISLVAEGRTERTHETPHDDASFAIMGVVVALSSGAVCARVSWWLLRNRRSLLDDAPRPVTGAPGPVEVGLVVVALSAVPVHVVARTLDGEPNLVGQTIATVAVAALGYAVARLIVPAVRRRRPHAT